MLVLGDIEALVIKRCLIIRNGAHIGNLATTVEKNAWPTEDAPEYLRDLFFVLIRKLIKLLLYFVDVRFDDISYDFEAEFLRSRHLIFHHSLLDSLF